MAQLLIAVASGMGFEPDDFVAVWNTDGDASAVGTATIEAPGDEVFIPGLVELVVIPMVVNVASSVAYDLVKKLVARLRPKAAQEPRVEQPEVAADSGDVIIVIRSMGGPQ